MARFMVIVLSAILCNSFGVATECDDDSSESSEETTSSPPQCDDREVLDNCPVDCPSDYCPKSRYVDQSRCPKPDECPPPACKCGFNSRRADNGTCISTRSCPPFKCKGVHEEYNPCPPYCPGENCSQATADGKCHLPGRIGIVLECKPACRCKKNYWRLDGVCVPYARCPKNGKPTTIKPITKTTQPRSTKKPKPTCGDNEVVDDCPTDCPANYCPRNRYTDQSPCRKPRKCPPPRCKCRFNFRRTQNGSCIPTEKCPAFECNRKNEEFNPCPPYCPGENCNEATPDGECNAIGKILIPVNCKPACRCKKNYWRFNGNCIPYSQCPNVNNSIVTTEKNTPKTTEPDDDNQTTTTAMPPTCGDNEVLDTCPVKCPSDYCPTSRYDDQSICPKPDDCHPPACKCGFNSRRAKNGTCIPTRDCPPFECYGPNEEYNSCPPYCPGEDCSQATPDGECHAIGQILIVVECRPDCPCKKNFWRLNGTCVPYDQCPKAKNNTNMTTKKPPVTTSVTPKKRTTTVGPSLTCGDNEVAVECPDNCTSDYCPKNRNYNTLPCPKQAKCPPPACKCGFNTRRADNGTCISTTDCPPFACNGPNEVYNPCPSYCPEDCSQATPDGECHIFGSILIVLECEPACKCKKNYWRLNGTCVPYDKCQSSCPANENRVQCKNACSEQSCPKSEADTETRFCTQQCLGPGCVCRFNYRRSDNGSCISTRDCPPFDCSARPNEIFDPCPRLCPTDSCSDATPTGECRFNIGIVLECNPKCRCVKGYWRNTSGLCVPYDKCPQVCPPNEEYTDCMQRICRPQNCTDVADGQMIIDCEPDNVEGCKSGCVCKDGYLRADNGTCVLRKNCGNQNTIDCSGPYEEYTDCKETCPGDTCSALTSKMKCEDECCEPGCVCNEGYRRKTVDGPCVPLCECPEMTSAPGCQNITEPQCPVNEELRLCKSACSNDNCPKTEADTVPISCTQECRGPGCVCRTNYMRGDDGTCIPVNECPPIDCSARPNEVYDPCPPFCPTDNCFEATPTGECTIYVSPYIKAHPICNPKCRCIKGYWRNDSGICVPYEDCPVVE